ncbi:hypothetical protein TRFO_21209 [Tritrichomonas foetus]|uniref:Nucleoplasmin-like domain-containing protein n=1 Tax=Tritrichomonas foetus TaxID=1144522 RepID=A0A1J4KF20_9EUKA|nr:hypothetical protein TRFO_21209 [Tritrichomonas foetus]|eukprot:OHT09779.1 hypothetical protein TRFO_21209 [Tritrichomonas foetus]
MSGNKKFWSTIVKEGNTATADASESEYLIITNLSIPYINENSTKPVRLFAKCSAHSDKAESTDVLVATLAPGVCEHKSVHFRILPGEKCILEARGPHQVHAIGFYAPPEAEEEESQNEFSESPNDEEEEEEEEEDLFVREAIEKVQSNLGQ